MTLILLFSLSFYGIAFGEKELGGTLQAEINGQTFHLPSLRTDIAADIVGDSATVTVIQYFGNPTKMPINATYLFPLNRNSAVYWMSMEVGMEIIEAQIMKIEKAKTKFNSAKKEGKAASLLTQHRPNMFTQKVANLMPNLPIKVTLKYVQTVPKIDGNYQVVIPLIVGPRYQPEGSGEAPTISDEEENDSPEETRSDTRFAQWEIEKLPIYPQVGGLNIPDTIAKDRVSIKVNIKSGVPFGRIYSETHPLNVIGKDKNKYITLAEGRTIDNRDFVLLFQLSGEKTQASILSHKTNKEGFFSLMIEPPKAAKTDQIIKRELVFVLDTSGSMSGEPISASKLFMRHALKNLRETDYFRVIRFSNNASEFTEGPIPATSENIFRGLQYVNSLDANGGTEIPNAIRQAFSTSPIENTIRIVVFLTDGYIGNESEVLTLISESIGKARIYAFGVGTSVNRFLLNEMGRRGRGFARFIDPTENPEDVAIKLASKIKTPVLTNIAIDWGGLEVAEVTPKLIPDLFEGDSIRILGKFTGSGNHTIKVNGFVPGGMALLPVDFNIPEPPEKNSESPLPLIWARGQISDHMNQMNLPMSIKTTSLSDTELKEKVIQLGLNYSLMTRWTSFVAVSKAIVNPNPEQSKDSQVPLPMVKGVGPKAYGQPKTVVLAQNFSGGSTPEPTTWASLLLVSLLFFAFMSRKVKHKPIPSK